MVKMYFQEWKQLEHTLIMRILFWFSIIAISNIILYSLIQRFGGPIEIPWVLLGNLKAISFYIPVVAIAYLFSRDSDINGMGIYFLKMMVVISMFMITFSFTFPETKVRDLHSMLVIFIFIPVMILIRLLLKNRFFSIVLNVGLCWLLLGFAHALQNVSPFKNYLIPVLSNEMIVVTIRNVLVGDEVQLFFTLLFGIASILSILLGVFLIRRKQKKVGRI